MIKFSNLEYFRFFFVIEMIKNLRPDFCFYEDITVKILYKEKLFPLDHRKIRTQDGENLHFN